MALSTELILKNIEAGMVSYNGFVWPKSGKVICPDWEPTFQCGHGFHGLLRGEGSGQYFCTKSNAVWLVIEAKKKDILTGRGELQDKCKFRAGKVIYCGAFDGAQAVIVAQYHNMGVVYRGIVKSEGEHSLARSEGYGSTAQSEGYGSTAQSEGYGSTARSEGYGSTAQSEGYSSIARSEGEHSTAQSTGEHSLARSEGERSIARSTGDYSTARSEGEHSTAQSTGNGSTARSTGDYSTAQSTGNYSLAQSTGYSSTARSEGYYCRAVAGNNGCIQLCLFDGERKRIITGYIGENGLKPNVAYKLNDKGEFEEA